MHIDGEAWWRAALRGSSTVLSLFSTYEAARADRHTWAARLARARAVRLLKTGGASSEEKEGAAEEGGKCGGRAPGGFGVEWGLPVVYPSLASRVERAVKRVRANHHPLTNQSIPTDTQ